MSNCIKTGAYVYLIDYGKYGPADIYAVGDDALVVRFNGDIEHSTSFKPQREVTHTLYLNNHPELFWAEREGFAVVTRDDLVDETS